MPGSFYCLDPHFANAEEPATAGSIDLAQRIFRPLRLESLEDRRLLAAFTPTTVAELITDINTANWNNEPDTIELGGGVFTLTAPDNTDNGLPMIAADFGNGLTIQNGTIRRDTSAGTPQFRLLEVATDGDLTLDGMTLTGGHAAGHGGGLRVNPNGAASVTRSTITGNRSDSGGGGISNSVGSLDVHGSTLADNLADDGGGISNLGGTVHVTNSTINDNMASGYGGGIFISVGTVDVANSTINGNTAVRNGGGVFIFGHLVVPSTLNVTNSTISGNSSAQNGGGIYNSNRTTLQVLNSTIAGNTADNTAGGIRNLGTASLNNTIVAGNTGGDLEGTFLSGTNNLVQDGSGNGLSGTVVANPMLGPLQNNGGPTETHALSAGSPAIDAGNNNLIPTDMFDRDDDMNTAEPDPFDQRGLQRIFNSTVDIGAFELALVVTTADDELDADISDPSDLSLREAVGLANGSVGFNEITFDASLVGATIFLTMGQIEITDSVSIAGLGSAATRIDAQQNSRIFDIPQGSGDVTLRGMTLTGGQADSGGAIRSLLDLFDSLTVKDSTITGNTAIGNEVDPTRGGGIYAMQSLNIENSRITGNTASSQLTEVSGGGVSAGSATITNSGVSGNTVSGGAMDAVGGGVAVSRLNVVGSTISGNSVTGGGSVRGGGLAVRDDLSVSHSTISGNWAASAEPDSAEGGGVYVGDGFPYDDIEVYFTSSTISGNSADAGGGIFAVKSYGPSYYNSSLTLVATTVSGNTARTSGGGIAGAGKPIWLSGSTISGNSAGLRGGGIYGGDFVWAVASTISGNTATRGGGVFSRHAIFAFNCTVTANTATGAGGGLVVDDLIVYDPNLNPYIDIRNSIVAGNTDNGVGPDIDPAADPILYVVGSLIGDNTATDLSEAQPPTPDGNGNFVGDPTGGGIIDPMLGPLGANGGPTQTHAPLPGSPVLNTGEPDVAQMPSALFDDPVGLWELEYMFDVLDSAAKEGFQRGSIDRFSDAISRPGAVPPPGTGMSLEFSGDDFGTIDSVPIAADFSVELWAKSTTDTWNASGWWASASGLNGFVMNPIEGSTAWSGVVVDNLGNPFEIGQHDPGPGTITDFHHYAMTYDAVTDTGRMYFDGALVVENTDMLGPGDSRDMSDRIDIKLARNDQTGDFGQGSLDDVVQYDRVISPSEVQRHFESPAVDQRGARRDDGNGVDMGAVEVQSVLFPTINGPASPSNADPIIISVEFGEPVFGFEEGDLSVFGGAIADFDTTDDQTFTFHVSPTAVGLITVGVAADVTQNAAGDSNLAAVPFLITSDRTAPTPVIAGPAGPVGAEFDVMIDFGEPVSGFEAGEIVVSNGSVTNLTDSGGGSFTATINADVAGTVTVDVPAAVAGDLAGNDNNAASQFSVTVACSTTVSNTNDAGLGSLRSAIDCANAEPGLQTVDFDISGAGPHVIQPKSPLPDIRDPLLLDATSQPDYDGSPIVELDGSAAGSGASGLTIAGGGGGSTIRGLAVNRFDAHGIFVSRRDNVTIEHNYLGTDPTGMLDLGNGQAGVYIINGANNTVFGNVISGNEMGVVVEGPLSTGNVLQDNLIGIGADGAELENRMVNVDIAGAPGNTIGGTGGLGNTIVGSKVGIHIRGSAATGNLVKGNAIGHDPATGTPIFNNRGIEIKTGASGNTIGGPGEAGNVISGNTKGVLLNSVDNNLVHGNKIGTNEAGDAALPNTRGVLISGGSNNQIGDEPNVISGNLREGVRIFKPGSDDNLIRDNFIGTNADGNAAIPNRNGVVLSPDAGADNTIGGTTAAERNIISGNTRAGVALLAAGNEVVGNFIGTNASGASAVGNDTGVLIARGGNNNVIGGPVDSGSGNVISGNAEVGVRITGDDANGNVIAGNAIGTDLTGMAAVGNTHGVLIQSPGNLVGGPTTNDGNVISGNTQNGVYLLGAAATGNFVETNRIGINIDGTGAVPNERSGVLIENAAGNTVGGAGTGNAIGGNTQQGIRIAGAGSTGNLVQGNSIGFDAVTAVVIANRDGMRVADGASGNTVGGQAAGEANEIAGNTGRGVWINDGTGNTVTRNSIHDNAALGISIGGQARTPNDPDDPDAGANNLHNFPEIASAVLDGGNLDVAYSIPTIPGNSAFPITVEFFLADNDGEEGETFLGQHSYAAPGTATASIDAGAAQGGSVIVVTATDADGNTSEFSAAATVLQTLLAASGEADGGSARSLTHPTLVPIVDAAVERFVDAGFASDLFDNVEVTIADLPNAVLGLATGNTITIDTNAAGHGWFVDATPWEDSEFSNRKSKIANQKSIDLLTVVLHELGHVAGLPDLFDPAAEDDLMYGWLEPGERQTSFAASLADESFASF